MNTRLILNVYGDRALESTDLTTLDFCLQVWMKSELYEREVDTRDELLARILDATDRMKKRADQLRRIKRDRCTRFAKCIEGDCGIYVHLL